MKPNVRLLSGVMVAMLLAPCGANAASATDVVKKLCVQKSDFVWDDTHKVCIYQNACDSGKDTNDGRYCVKTFKNTQVYNIETAKALASIYARRKLNSRLGCHFGWSDANNSFGQDYIGCHLTAGYVTFEFDDTNDSVIFSDLKSNNVFNILCTVLYSGNTNGDNSACNGIKTQEQCKEFQQDVIELYNALNSVSAIAGQYDYSKVGSPSTWNQGLYSCQYPWAD